MKRGLAVAGLGILLCGIIATAGFIIKSNRRFEPMEKASASSPREPVTAADRDEKKTERRKETPDSPKVPDSVGKSGTEIPETAAETEPVRTEPIRLTFAGDILLDERYAIMASLGNRSITEAFDEVLLDEMRGADIFMLNNEFPYTDRGTPVPEKQYTFRASPEKVNCLRDIGADIVSIANNHAYDYGEISLLDTLDVLDGIQMPHVGAGHDIEEARKPYIFELDGFRIAFVSATQIEKNAAPDTKGAGEGTPGVFRCLDDTLLCRTVEEAAQEADFTVVYVHWGTEGTHETDWMQKELAPHIAEAGADLIIGDHPHVLQGIEYCEGVPVFYSLGNYLFNSKTIDTCLVSADIDPQTAEITDLRIIPALQSGCRCRSLTGSEKLRVIQDMRSYSPGTDIDEEGHIKRN